MPSLSVSPLLGALLLIGSLIALWMAGVRLASPWAPNGLERALSVCVTVAAAVTIEALALGPFSLGTDPPALAIVSVALLILARAALPPPAETMWRELAEAVGGAGRIGRMAIGAAAGLALTWAGFALAEPSLDLDSVFFHLPEVSAWIDGGQPGSAELISNQYPIGNYPSTNEVIMAWAGGISSNVTPVLLWPSLLTLLLGLATVLALRSLGCRWVETALATAAVLLLPLVYEAVTGLDSDLASITWVAVSVSLCVPVATGRAAPELLAFAIVALGLAVGIKTSVVPLGALALLAALVMARRRPRLPAIGISLLVALMVGGIWYLRNLAEHGSLLWPFVDLPGGDPLPQGIAALTTSFAERPLATLDGRVSIYLDQLGAAPLLLAAALILPLLIRDRRLLLGAGAVAISLLLWSIAPATGEAPGPDGLFFSVTGVRYMMSTILLATGVIAVIASGSGRLALVARATLAVAVVWGLVELFAGRDGAPPVWLLIAGPLAGIVLTGAIGTFGSRAGNRSVGAIPAAVAAGLAGMALIAVLAVYPGYFLDRFADRSSAEDPLADARGLFGELAGWFEDQSEYRDGDSPITFSDPLIGPLSGGSFAHELRLIPTGASCEAVESMADGGWVVLSGPVAGTSAPIAACFAGTPPVAELDGSAGAEVRVYRFAQD